MKNIVLLFLSFLFILSSCETEKRKPLFPGQQPQPIKEYTVENISGASIIKCKITDPNTLYVKAVYTLSNGTKREAKSSKFDPNLRVDGFAEAKEYSVQVYAVSQDEQESAPTAVVVNPLEPPYLKILDDLDFEADYGGGMVLSENETTASVVVGVLVKNSNGEDSIVREFYTQSRDIKFSIRGFAPVSTDFYFYVRDQWLNYSDTVKKTITPWEEIQIDMSGYTGTDDNFPGDTPDNGARPKRNIFNGIRGNWTDGYYSDFQNLPQTITIKLPGTYEMSRIVLWQNYTGGVAYGSSNPKHIKIWGSSNPNPNGAYDESWFLLGEFDNWKPSGLPVDAGYTDDDLQAAINGNEFTFDRSTAQPVRYIRFNSLSNWGSNDRIYITELALFGRQL